MGYVYYRSVGSGPFHFKIGRACPLWQWSQGLSSLIARRLYRLGFLGWI